MAPTHVLDQYYLAITLLVTIAYQLTGFAIAWTFQFDKITDFTGGSNFFILALLTLLLGQNFDARNVIASVLVMVWATRLAGFLLFRVLKMGSDTRFDDIRSHFWKFFGFWVGQILWVWTVSLPVTILHSPSVNNTGRLPAFGTSRDIAGIVVWALGWLIESVADAQKYYYKSKGTPKNHPFNRGIWAWSRHPPYFGEILCWWGIWMLCIPPATNGSIASNAKSALLGSVVSPVFTTILLLFGSGLPTAEKPTAKKFYLMSHGPDASDPGAWKAYKAFLEKTPILVLFPTSLYKVMPRWIKSTVLLDFPFYRFEENKDGEKAIEEANAQKAERERSNSDGSD
jgi:steroid 5-alpha reductase family enzyme